MFVTPPDDLAADLAPDQTRVPGWSAAYGGPAGIAAATTTALNDLSSQIVTLSALRAEAINQMLTSGMSLRQVAARLGISVQATHRAAKTTGINSLYPHLINKEAW